MQFSMPINPLFLILFLAGTETIHETKRGSWWGKLNKIGFLCCICQLTLTVMGFDKERERSKNNTFYENNIVRFALINKQIHTLLIPFVYMVSKFVHVRDIEMFHGLSSRFDELITADKSHRVFFRAAISRLRVILFRMCVISAGVLVVLEVVNIGIGILYVIHSTNTTPQFDTFYFYQVTVVIILGSAFDVAVKLHGLEKRMHLLVEFQERLLEDMYWKEGKSGIIARDVALNQF